MPGRLQEEKEGKCGVKIIDRYAVGQDSLVQ